MKHALLIVAVAGCGSFEDPNIVVDLRVLAMSASLPDQLVEVDPTMPVKADAVLAQLEPVEVCVLLGDPANDRRVRWTMTMCNQNSHDRCQADDPMTVIGAGLLDDPDSTTPEPSLCATVKPDGNLLSVLLLALKDDTFRGLGGIGYQIQLLVGGEDDDPANDIYASKEVKVTPRIPADRTGNANPSLDRIDVRPGEDDTTPTMPIALGRCVDQPAPLEVFPKTKVRLTPIETAGAREAYVLPLVSGGEASFTESLTYQWSGAMGSFSKGTTGGKRDVTGNEPQLFTDWKAPESKDLDGPTDITLWIVQRDERLGVHWYETCIRVVP